MTERITIRLTKKERAKLDKLLAKSRYDRSLSELIRTLMFRKEITIQTFDASLDNLIYNNSLIWNEIRAIGININQVTRYFNTSSEPHLKKYYARKIGKLYQGVEAKITELHKTMYYLADKYLPVLYDDEK